MSNAQEVEEKTMYFESPIPHLKASKHACLLAFYFAWFLRIMGALLQTHIKNAAFLAYLIGHIV